MISSLLVRGRMLVTRHTHWRNLSKSAQAPEAVQSAVLHKILHENADTRYGRDHDFGKISSYKQFAERVPVVSYETLRPYIEEQLQSGTPALTAAAPVMYAKTSGTTGQPKYVPIVPEELRMQRRHTALLSYGHYAFDPLAFNGKIWAMVAPADEERLENGIPCGSASGLLYASMSRHIATKYVIPPEAFTIEDHALKYRLILLLALAEKNITYLSAANPTTLLKLCALANEYGLELAEDIERGNFRHEARLSPGVVQAVRTRLSANTVRATELRQLFSCGRPATFENLWPALRLVSTWTGGNCAVAAGTARNLLAPSTHIVELGYLSSEFRGTITVNCNTGAGLPTINDYFFEFIEPKKWEAGSREFRLVHQLEPGCDYYIVVTTPSGLYRYFINDIVRPAGTYHSTPTIRFVQKGKGVTNITGEKLYESQVTEALHRAEKRFGLRPVFYLMLADVEQQIYRLHLEVADTTTHATEVAQSIDRSLTELNEEYRVKRESGRLNPLGVSFLKRGAGEAYRTHCIQAGQKDGQFKVLALQYAHQCEFPFQSYTLRD